jgi:hypothetical protein
MLSFNFVDEREFIKSVTRCAVNTYAPLTTTKLHRSLAMADNILPHVDADSYQIPFKNLEDIHNKIMQSDAVLSLLGEWVCESGSSLFAKRVRIN